jgi:hypothetical protein
MAINGGLAVSVLKEATFNVCECEPSVEMLCVCTAFAADPVKLVAATVAEVLPVTPP